MKKLILVGFLVFATHNAYSKEAKSTDNKPNTLLEDLLDASSKGELETKLLRYSRIGDLERVKLLVESGKVDVHAKDYIGWTALMRASENGQLDVVKYLVKTDDAGSLALMSIPFVIELGLFMLKFYIYTIICILLIEHFTQKTPK